MHICICTDIYTYEYVCTHTLFLEQAINLKIKNDAPQGGEFHSRRSLLT